MSGGTNPGMGAVERPQTVLRVDGISAEHGRGSQRTPVLDRVDLRIGAGESVAVVGPSGAGKSTLAEVVLGLHRPAAGTVRVHGNTWCAPGTPPHRARRRLVQGVPQDPGAALVPGWSVRRSIDLALRRLGTETDSSTTVQRAVHQAADLAGLERELLQRRPSELSGGQAQRAALTRALAVGPSVLVADEPTSALDPDTATQVASSLLTAVQERGIALLLVTHDPDLARRCTSTTTIEPFSDTAAG
jgi:ABC-type dipeptide/oligopeptide/nickel transport system ATPase subunit